MFGAGRTLITGANSAPGLKDLHLHFERFPRVAINLSLNIPHHPVKNFSAA
jgi:hypothetical protein